MSALIAAFFVQVFFSPLYALVQEDHTFMADFINVLSH